MKPSVVAELVACHFQGNIGSKIVPTSTQSSDRYTYDPALQAVQQMYGYEMYGNQGGGFNTPPQQGWYNNQPPSSTAPPPGGGPPGGGPPGGGPPGVDPNSLNRPGSDNLLKSQGGSAQNRLMQDYYAYKLGTSQPNQVDSQGNQYNAYGTTGQLGAAQGGGNTYASHSPIGGGGPGSFQENPQAWEMAQGYNFGTPSAQDLAAYAATQGNKYQTNAGDQMRDLAAKYGSGNQATWSPQDQALAKQLSGASNAYAPGGANGVNPYGVAGMTGSENGINGAPPGMKSINGASQGVMYQPGDPGGQGGADGRPYDPSYDPNDPNDPNNGPHWNPLANDPAANNPEHPDGDTPILPNPPQTAPEKGWWQGGPPPQYTGYQAPNPGTATTWGAGGASGNRNLAGGAAYGSYAGQLQNPNIDPRVQNAITQQGMNATRAQFAGQQGLANRHRAVTGNSAGFAAQASQAGRDQAGAYGMQARQNTIDFEKEAQRRKEAAQSGLTGMYNTESQYQQGLLGGMAGVSGKAIGTDSAGTMTTTRPINIGIL